MASIGLSEAARLAGRNQSTIHRAMKAGRLSYTTDEAGERRVDVAELERVFGIRTSELRTDPKVSAATAQAPQAMRSPLQAMSRMSPKANA
jgi:predicted site-specific integrase-resolvase